jgi:hypothetical protein
LPKLSDLYKIGQKENIAHATMVSFKVVAGSQSMPVLSPIDIQHEPLHRPPKNPFKSRVWQGEVGEDITALPGMISVRKC